MNVPRHHRERERSRAELLESEIRRLTEFLSARRAERVVLIGSTARGQTDLFADIDMIVVIDSDEPFVERIARFYREAAPRVASDILLYTPQEYEAMKDTGFLRNALKGGVVLYEKESS